MIASALDRLGMAEEAPVSSGRVAAPRQVDEDHPVVREQLEGDRRPRAVTLLRFITGMRRRRGSRAWCSTSPAAP